MTDQVPSTDSFFDGVGESGAPSFKFSGVGTGIKGTVVDQYATFVTEPGSREPKTYKDGTPIPQLNVTLQTELRGWKNVSKVPKDKDGNPLPASEDDGKRRIYVKYQMRNAVGAAIKAASERALATGGTLAVKQTGEDDRGKANPLPIFEARYTAPKPEEEFFSSNDGQQDPWAVGGSSTGAAPASQPAADDEPPF